ncbi:MAG: hypothetical protein ABFC96_11510, partial [Thermoguttaceae bacterium]
MAQDETLKSGDIGVPSTVVRRTEATSGCGLAAWGLRAGHSATHGEMTAMDPSEVKLFTIGFAGKNARTFFG